jgi:hypothetical protein
LGFCRLGASGRLRLWRGSRWGCLSGLAFGKNKRYLLSDLRNTPVAHIDFLEHAIIEGLHFHGGLVGFHLGEDVTRFYGVALFLSPARNGSFDHRVAQLGHRNNRHGECGDGDSGLVLANLQHLADYTLRSRELERFNGG